ncbi:MAG: dihydrolipoyl dehydrogenase [Sphingomonadales bacterium]
MSNETYDVVVIGAGPGGYVAAIRAAQHGLKVACVEKRATLGGTCLNVGCIPSKALLHTSELFEHASHLGNLGVKVSGVALDLKAMMGHKDKVVDENTQGIELLFKKNKVTRVEGAGRVVDAGTVEVTPSKGKKSTLRTRNIIIATGSESATIPGIEIDEKRVLSSTGALELPKVPKHMVVIGAGVIGLELGSVWRRLGADVTVLEYLDRITPEMDGEVAKSLARILGKQGIVIKTGVKVTGVKTTKTAATVTYEPAKGGDAEDVRADVVLMAVGRKPHTADLGLAEAGVELDDRGRVKTDGHWATNVKGIYAIGDVIKGPMLAHKAEDEGMAVADEIAGKRGHVNYEAIPGVIYTMPEVASVGRTEEALKNDGIEYKVGKFPMMANGRARATARTEGFVKILSDARTDEVLGVHIIAADAGNMIAEAVLAMDFKASAEDIAMSCHAHPTEMEAVREAALALGMGAIHI